MHAPPTNLCQHSVQGPAHLVVQRNAVQGIQLGGRQRHCSSAAGNHTGHSAERPISKSGAHAWPAKHPGKLQAATKPSSQVLQRADGQPMECVRECAQAGLPVVCEFQKDLERRWGVATRMAPTCVGRNGRRQAPAVGSCLGWELAGGRQRRQRQGCRQAGRQAGREHLQQPTCAWMAVVAGTSLILR
jgi:hypothetical protein